MNDKLLEYVGRASDMIDEMRNTKALNFEYLEFLDYLNTRQLLEIEELTEKLAIAEERIAIMAENIEDDLK